MNSHFWGVRWQATDTWLLNFTWYGTFKTPHYTTQGLCVFCLIQTASRHQCFSALPLVKCVRSVPDYFAGLLYKSMRVRTSTTPLSFTCPRVSFGWESKHHLLLLNTLLCSACWNRWQHPHEDNGVEERAGHAGHQSQLPEEVRSVSLLHYPGTPLRQTQGRRSRFLCISHDARLNDIIHIQILHKTYGKEKL